MSYEMTDFIQFKWWMPEPRLYNRRLCCHTLNRAEESEKLDYMMSDYVVLYSGYLAKCVYRHRNVPKEEGRPYSIEEVGVDYVKVNFTGEIVFFECVKEDSCDDSPIIERGKEYIAVFIEGKLQQISER